MMRPASGETGPLSLIGVSGASQNHFDNRALSVHHPVP
ncbi:hypothetical protein I546_1587 [Mycobacterium kansasii 732]|nr:hypothetical protein I546_1587 [Mycobacterium kansasii 732]